MPTRWMRRSSLWGCNSLTETDVLVQEIADDLLAALKLFASIAEELKG